MLDPEQISGAQIKTLPRNIRRTFGLVWLSFAAQFQWGGRTTAQASKKGSREVLGEGSGKGSQEGSQKGAGSGFYSKKGFWEVFSEGVLRIRCFEKMIESTNTLGVRPIEEKIPDLCWEQRNLVLTRFVLVLPTHHFLFIPFSFFPPLHSTPLQATSSPKPPLSGTSELFFCGGEGSCMWGGVWTRSTHRKKRNSFKNGAPRKVFVPYIQSVAETWHISVGQAHNHNADLLKSHRSHTHVAVLSCQRHKQD